MARKSLLSPAMAPAPKAAAPAANQTPVVVHSADRPMKRENSNKGKFHLGGYYDPNSPVIEAFRVMCVRQRRSQQELLLEAVTDLIAKYETAEKFG